MTDIFTSSELMQQNPKLRYIIDNSKDDIIILPKKLITLWGEVVGKEGERNRILYIKKQDAILAFEAKFFEMLIAQEPNVIIWRTKPFLVSVGCSSAGCKYLVYARFLLANLKIEEL